MERLLSSSTSGGRRETVFLDKVKANLVPELLGVSALRVLLPQPQSPSDKPPSSRDAREGKAAFSLHFDPGTSRPGSLGWLSCHNSGYALCGVAPYHMKFSH
eukprot:TRINITY_DN31264_c0_g1_i1.p1 TRINITY_DN31264_c0_g1~~TRINITY_DN31264_c0_g1_i1.p1  ORF type:complete len:102 (+),score=5.42 TRINITY_DN31264_c0_g1_i1:98-403(+)